MFSDDPATQEQILTQSPFKHETPLSFEVSPEGHFVKPFNLREHLKTKLDPRLFKLGRDEEADEQEVEERVLEKEGKEETKRL